MEGQIGKCKRAQVLEICTIFSQYMTGYKVLHVHVSSEHGRNKISV